MDISEKRELDQAFEFLLDAGIELRSAEGGYDVWLKYREFDGAEVQSRAVAKVVHQGRNWDVSIAPVALFWGPDWESHPDLVGCDSLDGVLQFLFEALQPRLDRHGVLSAWLPRGTWE